MSPKRERRRQARRETSLSKESGIQPLGVLLLLCGLGMFYSGLYLAGVIPEPLFPRIERLWDPTSTALLIAAAGDLVAGATVATLGVLGIRKRLAKRPLYIVMACAFLGLVSDLLGGLYAVSAQVTWYLGLFTVLFRRRGE